MGGTTGVSLEQGLGLTDVPRGCPGRRPGRGRSYAPGYYFNIYKINPSAGIRGPVCPRVPRSVWILEPPVFVEIFCVAENIFLETVSSSHLRATSKTLLGFGVLGRCLREG